MDINIDTSPSALRALADSWDNSGHPDDAEEYVIALRAVASEKEAQAAMVNDLIMSAQERGLQEGLLKGREQGAAAVRDRVLKNIFGA